MPYPLDDNGNIRVDFVWGNVPMQPDEQRTDTTADWVSDDNQSGDRGWSAPSYGATSDTVNTEYTQYLSRGDVNTDDWWSDPAIRTVTVPSIHDIATTGYNNYPAFLPDYAGDGDIGFEWVMPNLVGMTSNEFVSALQAAKFSGATGTTARYAGSTTANHGRVFSQTPAAGATVNDNTQPQLVRYVRPQVPNLVGLTEAAATSALTALSLVKGTVTTSDNAGGATAENDGLVKTQSVAETTVVDGGTTVNIVKYEYTFVATEVPNIVGLTESAAISILTIANLTVGDITTADNASGATTENNGLVKEQTPIAGTAVTSAGATVSFVKYAYVAPPATTGEFNTLGYDADSNRYYFFPVATAVPTQYVGSTITIDNFVADPSRNGNYVIDAITPDLSVNVAGQKVWLLIGAFVWQGVSSSSAATWTLAV